MVTIRQKFATVEDLRSLFQRFFVENGRYPTSADMLATPYLPHPKTLERRYGGTVAVRNALGLDTTDFTKGDARRDTMRVIGPRALLAESETYAVLVERFGVMAVHREFMFLDDRRYRTDFYVYAKQGNFCVDVFYPQNKASFAGCLRHKVKKYQGNLLQYPVIFLCVNPAITEQELQHYISRRKTPMYKAHSIMSQDSFSQYIKTKTPVL